MVKPALTNRYSNFEFPEYEYREFPKAVTHNGKVHVVNDAEEEKALKAVVRDYRKEALDRAKELKLDIPNDWDIKRIQAYTNKVESDIEFEALMKEDAKNFDEKDPTKTSIFNKLQLPYKKSQ
jgi:hypothetical protein